MQRFLSLLAIIILITAAACAITHHTDYAILGIIIYLSMLQLKYEDS